MTARTVEAIRRLLTRADYTAEPSLWPDVEGRPHEPRPLDGGRRVASHQSVRQAGRCIGGVSGHSLRIGTAQELAQRGDSLVELPNAGRRGSLVPCRPTEEYPLSSNIVTTFLELGNATSHNLKFSHCKNVFVSYGEETITENNLLEIRWRHPDRVYVKTFFKAKEAQSGADWEWHIVGRKLTLKMRVQAKRVQRDGKLKIKHKVKSSGRQQHDLLLDGARADNVKPLYCIYCTEPQSLLWTQSHPMDDFEGYQTGWLLVDANDVPVATTKLDKIEHKCIPWHYLFEQEDLASRRHELIGVMPDREVSLVSHIVSLRADYLGDDGKGRSPEEGWKAPTIADLNRGWDGDFDSTGVAKTNEEDLKRLRSAMAGRTYLGQEDQAKDRGEAFWIPRMLVIDARD